jgi:hypothetical protein
MEQKYKVLFNLINPALLKSNCKKATMEFDEGFSPYQDGYYCNHMSGKRISFLVPVERELSEYVEEYVGDNTWHEETGSEYYTYELEINSEFRSVEIFGTYTVYDTEEINETVIDQDEEPDELKPIFDYLEEVGSDILEVNVDAGGDSGWVHDENDDVNGKTIQTSEQMSDVCYRLLSQHPGWEINEGSYSKFTFDPHRRIIIWEFAYNTEEQARELISSERF